MNVKVNVARVAALAALAAMSLASCGGGTQIESFVPERIISFGDETGLVNTDGTKYTVNTLVFDTTVSPIVPAVPPVLNCSGNIVWAQQLAYSFGFAFTNRCELSTTRNTGLMLSTYGAKVADLSAQVSGFLATDAFASHDLVAVMVGVNDVIDAFENSADATGAVEAAGTQVGAEVVRITDLGAKVIVSTIPDISLSPYAISREATTPGTVARLHDLSVRFNTRLRLKLQEVRDGGRAVGLVLADELVLTMARNAAGYGLTNITEAPCPVTAFGANLTQCDVSNVTEVDPLNPTYAGDWLWADDRHLGANAQGRLGSSAVNRARSNPF